MVIMFDDFDTMIQSDEFAAEYEDYSNYCSEQEYLSDHEEEYYEQEDYEEDW